MKGLPNMEIPREFLDFFSEQEYATAWKELADRPVLSFSLTGIEALSIIGHLQLALRHPDSIGDSSRLVERLTHSLQEQIATEGPLAQVMEAGWHPEYDVSITPRAERAARPVPLTEQTSGFKIDTIWAYLGLDENGTEGICAWKAPDGWMPLVGADEARRASLAILAQRVVEASGIPAILARFSVRTDEETLTP